MKSHITKGDHRRLFKRKSLISFCAKTASMGRVLLFASMCFFGANIFAEESIIASQIRNAIDNISLEGNYDYLKKDSGKYCPSEKYLKVIAKNGRAHTKKIQQSEKGLESNFSIEDLELFVLASFKSGSLCKRFTLVSEIVLDLAASVRVGVDFVLGAHSIELLELEIENLELKQSKSSGLGQSTSDSAEYISEALSGTLAGWVNKKIPELLSGPVGQKLNQLINEKAQEKMNEKKKKMRDNIGRKFQDFFRRF